ncbi:hypothetical protein QR680_016675 [Steinernema hermaphroditum]|uniref:Uncharacterized protein n=1 Tax=Steinernema hermaphroditum TaxID=289476 RepID=A0AA39LN10_9BILA|nr:hypothetical protein QR680_016675 [Steinernema hermaphroditum]
MEFTRRSVIGVVLVLFALYVLLFIWSFTTLYELAENKALLVGDTLGKVSFNCFILCGGFVLFILHNE